jgi:hypothetical protein
MFPHCLFLRGSKVFFAQVWHAPFHFAIHYWNIAGGFFLQTAIIFFPTKNIFNLFLKIAGIFAGTKFVNGGPSPGEEGFTSFWTNALI